MRLFITILILSLSSTFLFAKPSQKEISKRKKALIAKSIRAYPGNCPCPYSRTKSGRRCGKRSAYSKPGGASPLCFESDISDATVIHSKN